MYCKAIKIISIYRVCHASHIAVRRLDYRTASPRSDLPRAYLWIRRLVALFIYAYDISIYTATIVVALLIQVKFLLLAEFFSYINLSITSPEFLSILFSEIFCYF